MLSDCCGQGFRSLNAEARERVGNGFTPIFFLIRIIFCCSWAFRCKLGMAGFSLFPVEKSETFFEQISSQCRVTGSRLSASGPVGPGAIQAWGVVHGPRGKKGRGCRRAHDLFVGDALVSWPSRAWHYFLLRCGRLEPHRHLNVRRDEKRLPDGLANKYGICMLLGSTLQLNRVAEA